MLRLKGEQPMNRWDLFRVFILAFLAHLSMTAKAENVEYYHCTVGPDTYWKFDIEALSTNAIDPFAVPAVLRQLGDIVNLDSSSVSFDKNWFKVITGPGGELEQIFYISRKGETSIMKIRSILGSVTKELGVCKDIVGEDLSTFFKEFEPVTPEIEDPFKF
ncbi:hypothetical protein DJ031_16735 [bacterium endosymbiont of Escarpia laminata]|nr:MAG: hypothetical protein DJ031_16735 [bacterium endosymbiont of Escarpia laminata]